MLATSSVSRWGLKGRVRWLFMAVFCEGLALMLFSQMTKETFADLGTVQRSLLASIGTMIIFSSVCANVRRGDLLGGAVRQQATRLAPWPGSSGRVATLGAVAAGFLFKTKADELADGVCSFLA